MSKIKNGGLDQHRAEPCEQQQFGTGGVEGVNSTCLQDAVTKVSVQSKASVFNSACESTVCMSATAETCQLIHRAPRQSLRHPRQPVDLVRPAAW